MAAGRLLVGFWIVTLLAGQGASRAQEVDPKQLIGELEVLADPTRDDWASEAWQAIAAKQLGRLAAVLASGAFDDAALKELFTAEAKGRGLRPEPDSVHDGAGGFQVERWVAAGAGTEGRVGSVLARLARVPAATEVADFRFKIVGVDWGDGRAPVTQVRFESVASSPGGPLQQVGRASVRWRPGEAGEPPLIDGFSILALDDVRREAQQFEDATASVLPPALLDRQLGRGGEYWHGRIDAVGEPNFMGHQGIAVGDVNGDGLDDLYVAMGTGLPNKLLVQQADGTVRDTALAAGVAWLDDTKGVLFADMDNDGDQDLLAAMGPTILLCKNDGRGVFDGFVGMRAATPAAFYSLSVADYDLDGDLDLYGARYVKIGYGISVPVPFHDANNGPSNWLLRNDGQDRYADVTRQVGLDVNNRRFSLIGVWNDYDADGDPDLYVANDFGRNNLYRNDGGRFVDVAGFAGAEDQAAGMGVSWSDYDGDGDFDLHVTNMYSAAGGRVAYQPRFQTGSAAEDREGIRRHSRGNSLLQNQGDGSFRDVGDDAGIRMGRWGWGARFVDLDDDGLEDLVAPAGFLTGQIKDDL